MEILTTDGRRLFIARIGEPDCEKSDKIICYDEQYKVVSIIPAEIVCFYGSYTFTQNKIKN